MISVSRVLLMGWVLLVALALGACGRQERIISITTDPPGALVTVNDVELGRSPVETEFTFFGVYDVRITKEGYEPLLTSKEAVAPLHEYPVVDLFATAIPGTRRTHLDWHFQLTARPAAANQAASEADLLARAKAFAAGVPAGADAPAAAPASPPASESETAPAAAPATDPQPK